MRLGKIICVGLLSLSMVLGTLNYPTVAQNGETKVPAEPTVFSADFTSLRDGAVSKSDTETVNALQSKFTFFHEQEGYYFERPKVNGYLCYENGADTYDIGQSHGGVNYRMPDTGLYSNFTNFDGANNDWGYPVWTVDGKWLYLNAHPCNYAYRHAGIIYPASASSSTGLATLENFTLEMDFKFREYDENHVQFMGTNYDSLAIFARQWYAGSIRDNSQSLFNINFNGTADVGTGWGLGGNAVQLKDANGKNTSFVRGAEYHLTLTAVGTAVNYTVKASDGTVAATGSFAAPKTGQGYLGISGSNEGVAMANIEITRLDSDGNAVDFYDENNGWGVGFNAGTLMRYRHVSGNRDGNYSERMYLKNPEGSIWTYTVSSAQGMYTFNDEATEAEQEYVDAINEKFNVYFNYYHHNLYTKMDNLFVNTSVYDSDPVVPNIKTQIQGGSRLFFQYAFRCHAEWVYSNMISLVPKTADGNEAVLKNFECEFTPALYWSDDAADGVSLSFRSAEAGRNSGYGNKVTLAVGQKGFALYDNEVPANRPFDSGNYIPWNGGNCAAPTIKVKVVGNTLTLYATDGSRVLYNGTFELKDGADTGYLYFSAANYWCGLDRFAVKRLDNEGNPAEWEDGDTDRTIVSVYSGNEDITVDRSKGETISLPARIVGEDASGNRYNIPVEWSSKDYRSYLNKDFDFVGTVTSDQFKVADGTEIKLKVKNRINGDFNTETSRKYYFDHGNDLLDFTCRHSSYDLSEATSGYKKYPVTMEKVSASSYWNVLGGRAVANYAKTVNGGWNGMTRLSDITSMLLEDPEMMLINYKLELDYLQPYGYYSYVLTSVQDPTKAFGDLWLNTDNADLLNGVNSDVALNSSTGGIYTYMEREGYFNNYGAVEGGIVRFEMDIPGYSFIKNYTNNLNNMHHMTITVVDGKFGIQVDDSAVYYTYVVDEALGGYVGFGGQGGYCVFDNFQITALDEFGEPMSLAEAEKGFAPKIPEDTYKGWNPSADQLKFVWGKDYEY